MLAATESEEVSILRGLPGKCRGARTPEHDVKHQWQMPPNDFRTGGIIPSVAEVIRQNAVVG